MKVTEKVTITEGTVDEASGKHHHKKKHDGCSWLVWVLVIFIIIILIIMAIMWWAQPECVTRECSDGSGREVSPQHACGYAFGIAVLVILLLAIIWACCAW